MLKSVFSRVMNWIGYTLFFSCLPIIILFMLAVIFKYDFTLANIANLYITDCALAVVVWRDAIILRDIIGNKVPYVSFVQYLMIWACILSSTFFSALSITQGADLSLAPEITKHLQYAAVSLLCAIATLGIATQIYIGISVEPHDEE